MRTKYPIAVWLILMLSGCLLVGCKNTCSEPSTEVTEVPVQLGEPCHVKLIDPIEPDLPEQSYTVDYIVDGRGFPKEFRLQLDIAVCLDDICKPLTVTLYWDALGNYSRLTYPEGWPFTKKEDEEFTADDYIRLDEVLKDKISILGDHPLSFFVRIVKHTDDVDGVSAATTKEVKDAVVPGAAYTTWVLWRWANGEVGKNLIAHTASQSNEEYLLQCLRMKDPAFATFALGHISETAAKTPEVREQCFEILKTGGQKNSAMALNLLSKNSSDTVELHKRLIPLLAVNDESTPLILAYFQGLATAKVEPELWGNVSTRLVEIEAYHHVSAVLGLLEKRAKHSEVVRANVQKLISRENKFVARLAERFLAE